MGPDAPTQPSADQPATDQPAGDVASKTEPGKGKDEKASQPTGDKFDPKVLESEELWKQPRIQELLTAKKERDELVQKQKDAEEKSLESQKKFKELADKKTEEVKDLSAKLEKNVIDQALTSKLVSEGVVDLTDALKLIDRSGVKMDKDGNVAGVDEAVETLKKKDYLFNSSNGSGGVGTATNPGNDGKQAQGTTKTFKRSQLQDQSFYQANREDILAAQKAGTIEDDIGK